MAYGGSRKTTGGSAWATRRAARAARAALSRLMLDAVSEARRGRVPWSDYSGIDVAQIVSAAELHKIAPSAYVHVKAASGVPRAVVEPLHRRHQAQVLRQMQVRADLHEIVEVLADTGSRWAAIKGPVLAEHVWGRADLRQYSDLDIVVDRMRFREVLDALLSCGAQMVDTNWALIQEQVRGEVTLTLHRGTMLDLHWHVVNDRDVRAQFPFPIEAMLERARHVCVAGLMVPTFDPADTLLHVAYHTAHSGGHRLLWLKDVERAAADPALDWAKVLSRGRAYGLEKPLAVVLERVRRVIGFQTPPPATAFRPARGLWGTMVAAADSWRPPPLLPGDRYSSQILFKSVRPTLGASVAAAVRGARDRNGPALDPVQNPLHVPSGGAAARDSYLRMIRAATQP